MVGVEFTEVESAIIPHGNYYAVNLKADKEVVEGFLNFNLVLDTVSNTWSECPRG